MYRFRLTDRRELRESLYESLCEGLDGELGWVGLGCVAPRVGNMDECTSCRGHEWIERSGCVLLCWIDFDEGVRLLFLCFVLSFG